MAGERRGTVAPIIWHADGSWDWAVPQIALDAWDGITAPYDAYTGALNPLSSEATRRSLSGAGFAIGAPITGTAERLIAREVPETVGNLSAKGPLEYAPPKYPQRPFKQDYPGNVPADETGRLTADIEGRPLTARHIAGRTQAGLPDRSSGGDLDAITAGALGKGHERVRRADIDGAEGETAVDLRTGRPLAVRLADDLHPDDVARVHAHEIGHVIDQIVRNIPVSGLEDELAQIYHSQATGQRWSAKPLTPQDVGYSDAVTPREYMAEAIRNYLLDPNSIKSAAPKTAARIREYVNANPDLNRTIQFNQGGAPASAVAGASVEQERGDDRMADLDRIKKNVGKMVSMGAPEADVDAYIAEEGVTLDAVRAHKIGQAVSAPAPSSPPAESKGWLRTIDDGVRGAADMLTFGLADEISAKAGELTGIGSAGGDYATNVAAERARDADGGVARLAGQVAGALAVPGAGTRTTLGAIRNGAVTGAAYGFGSGEGDIADRRNSAVAGALLGGAAGGAVQGVANALTTRAARATIPTNEALRAAGDAAYKQADNLGVIIRPESGQRLAASIKDDLANFGYDQSLHPGVGAVLSRLDDLGQQNTTLKGLDIVRRVARNAAADINNKSQQTIAGRVIDHIDDYIDNLGPTDVLAGDAREAGNAMLKARSLWSKLRKSEMVDTAAIKAERRAASTGSGGNLDNALRQNVRGLLDKPRTSAGMTAPERAMAERVVRGGFMQNRARDLGKLAPTGIVSGGIGTSLGAGVGSFVGGPAGASVGAVALPAFGQLMKSIADRTTVKNAERLGEIIRSGGLTAQEIARQAQLGIGPEELVNAVSQYRAWAGQLRPAAAKLAASIPDLVQ